MIFFALTWSPCFPSDRERWKQKWNDASRYILGTAVYALIFTAIFSCSYVGSVYSSGLLCKPIKFAWLAKTMSLQKEFLFLLFCYQAVLFPMINDSGQLTTSKIFFSVKYIQISLFKCKEASGANAWLLVQMRDILQQKNCFHYFSGCSSKPIIACHVYPWATIWLTCGQTPCHLNRWAWV